MKRFLLVAVLFLSISGLVSAQRNAIGLRFGSGAEVSYQYSMSTRNRIEANLGIDWWSIGSLTGIYQWTWDISEAPGLGWYAGVGAQLGFGYHHFGFGPAGQIGLNYNFNFPLQLSLDYRPTIKMYVGDHFGLRDEGFFDFAFSARYCF